MEDNMPAPLVLIVDDEEAIRESLSDIFGDEGYRVIEAESAEAALKSVAENKPDLVLLDVWLPGMDGIEALREIRTISPELPVLIISGHANIEMAVKATKLGAYDFLEKPLSLERVTLVCRRALERRRLQEENRELKETLKGKLKFVGKSAVAKRLLEQVALAGHSNSRVLIQGESGTGKELIARLLHDLSPRSRMPFVEVNCAAIPQELIESELFGHEKGSFTGAFEKKQGKFEMADGGTLFLDEIGDMSLQTQAKVLRAIETQEFQRVGGSKSVKVDIRFVTATNKDLQEEVKSGAFREDLLFRLNVIPIEVPPLRERRDDIEPLIEHFLAIIAGDYRKPAKKMTPEAITALRALNWPGNVRELKNTVERLVIMTPSEVIDASNIGRVTQSPQNLFSISTLKDARDAFEKEYLTTKLKENDWNISKTADALDMERSNLHRKIKAYGIDSP